MINWKEFFQNYRIVEINDDRDLLFQVGATVGGKPISEVQFKIMVQSINMELSLQKNDRLLDLCCGNGVITYEIAQNVDHVTGVDISDPYVENAKKFKQSGNIDYYRSDVTDASFIIGKLQNEKITKALLYASLAYFTPDDLSRILSYLNRISAEGCVFMIGSILDKDKKWNFFNTWKRKINYLFSYCLLGKDLGLGRWWTKKELEKIASAVGYSVRFIDQDPMLHTAHYRFDVILTKL